MSVFAVRIFTRSSNYFIYGRQLPRCGAGFVAHGHLQSQSENGGH
jgi:hypothetical protein